MADPLNKHYKSGHQTDRIVNRVYINPNYNRNPTEKVIKLTNNMYFNPNFSNVNISQHYFNNYDNVKSANTSSKIYINPNFIKPTKENNDIVSSYHKLDTVDTVLKSSTAQHFATQPKELPVESNEKMPHISMSRYSIVRRNDNKVAGTSELKPKNNTISVNKYKLVSINVVKTKLSAKTPASTPQPLDFKYKKTKCVVPHTNTRFKIMKCNMVDLHSISKIPFKNTSIINKAIVRIPRHKKVASVMKINNIPCPLFKKYGICLRRTRGTCDYLHDQKHVSICRKFLKGICHDKECLLSHDLTDKKMPTCHFYLQGLCTKEECPYLHVKISEKVKVCQEFLKGYCEKGDKCLYRHIDVSKTTVKKDRVKKGFSLKIKSKRRHVAIKKDKTDAKGVKDEDKSVIEQRYFKESVENETENCNLLKPTRCKLGALPSFIQL